MKIVVVGSGWLGVPLTNKFSSLNHQVSCVYRSNKPDVDMSVHVLPNVVTDELKSVLSSAELVVFCFPAPRSGESHAESCLAYALLTNPNCKFIFTSTTGVYPNFDAEMNESSELDDTSKHVQTEAELRSSLGNRLRIVRLAGLVGGNRFPVRMMSASGKTYNGNEHCNLLHLDDAVGIIEFLVSKWPAEEIINACALLHPSKEELYTAMAKALEIVPPKFEKGPTGKLIQSDLSIRLGYRYLKPNPFDFF